MATGREQMMGGFYEMLVAGLFDTTITAGDGGIEIGSKSAKVAESDARKAEAEARKAEAEAPAADSNRLVKVGLSTAGGAAIGSMVPVIGTAIGALVGGMIGLFATQEEAE